MADVVQGVIVVSIPREVKAKVAVVLGEELNKERMKRVLCGLAEMRALKSSLKEERQIVYHQLIHFGFLNNLQNKIYFL